MTILEIITIIVAGITILTAIFSIFIFINRIKEVSVLHDAITDEKLKTLRVNTEEKLKELKIEIKDLLKEIKENIKDLENKELYPLKRTLDEHIRKEITIYERLITLEIKLEQLIH